MAIRKDGKIELNLTLENVKTPADVRRFVLATWADEDFGEKYRYFVGAFEDGKRIYLERPARINKGCDFIVYIEDLLLQKNGYDKPPKHDFLLDDLRTKKKQLNAQVWGHLISSIESVHQMTPYDCPPDSKRQIDKLAPMSLQQIRLLCQWLFIEQDITYWDGEGRNMLMKGIKAMA